MPAAVRTPSPATANPEANRPDAARRRAPNPVNVRPTPAASTISRAEAMLSCTPTGSTCSAPGTLASPVVRENSHTSTTPTDRAAPNLSRSTVGRRATATAQAIWAAASRTKNAATTSWSR